MSETLHNQPIFKKGRLQIHFDAPRSNDSQLTLEQAAELTRSLNSVGSLKERFTGIDLIYQRAIPGAGIVETMHPSTPYGYGGVMVAVLSAEMLDENRDQQETQPTQSIHNLDPALQHEYFRQILANVQIQEDTQLPRADNGAPVIAYENAAASISNAIHRLPRTIAVPHTHIFKGGDWVDETRRPPLPHMFNLERRVVRDQERFEHLQSAWQQAADQVGLPRDIELRGDAPYGYTISCNIDRGEPLDEQAAMLVDMLSTHHGVYSEFIDAEVTKTDKVRQARREQFIRRSGIVLPTLRPLSETVLLQPSYRNYIYYKGGQLFVTISPMLLGSVGAVEAMDAEVSRSITHHNPFTSDELDTFNNAVAERLQQDLGR